MEQLILIITKSEVSKERLLTSSAKHLFKSLSWFIKISRMCNHQVVKHYLEFLIKELQKEYDKY